VDLTCEDGAGRYRPDVERPSTDLAVGSIHRLPMAEGLVTCHRKLAMVTCAELTGYWDQAIGRFLVGGPAVPPDPPAPSWAEAYRGRGEVNLDTLPEPYLGALDHRPVGVFLALHPGEAVLGFQGRSGRFAHEIRHHGTYSAWAATWPYLRDPWVAEIG
jgi:hypothetical protein